MSYSTQDYEYNTYVFSYAQAREETHSFVHNVWGRRHSAVIWALLPGVLQCIYMQYYRCTYFKKLLYIYIIVVVFHLVQYSVDCLISTDESSPIIYTTYYIVLESQSAIGSIIVFWAGGRVQTSLCPIAIIPPPLDNRVAANPAGLCVLIHHKRQRM